MSNIKKIIGVVLALVMALSVATVAFAATGDAYSVTVTADKTELAAGESATVTVKVTANYNVSAMSIPVFFDNTKVTADAGSTTLAGAEVITEASADVDALYAGSDRSKDTYGVRALSYIAPYYSAIKSYNDEAVMTFTVTAKDGASGAVVLECVEAAVKTSSNPSGTLYVAKNSSGSAEVDSLAEVIDDATITSATINIAGGEPNTLAIKDTAPFAPVIDTANAANTEYTAFIYGIDTLGWNDAMTPDGALSDFLTTALGDDYLVIEPADGGETTGTIIKVLDADGVTVLETYVFIYFGDVDMDGVVGASDAYACEYYEMNYMGFDNLYQFMAGDVDGDGLPGASDAYFFEYYEMNYTGMPTQADVAAVASTIAYEIF